MSATVDKIIWIVLEVVIIIGSIVLHEIGHGYAAYKMGDMTAKSQGRLSLNPLKHIDPFGSVILPLMLAALGAPIIGYAKPVPYNPNHFKDLRKGEIVVGLAGPSVNLLLALLFCGIGWLVYLFIPWTAFVANLWLFCVESTLINLCLLFFNLIPLPPLDGSSLIAPLLRSDAALAKYYSIQRYSLPILLAVIILIPMLTSFDPIGWYIIHTAYNIGDVLYGHLLTSYGIIAIS